MLEIQNYYSNRQSWHIKGIWHGISISIIINFDPIALIFNTYAIYVVVVKVIFIYFGSGSCHQPIVLTNDSNIYVNKKLLYVEKLI